MMVEKKGGIVGEDSTARAEVLMMMMQAESKVVLRQRDWLDMRLPNNGKV